MELVAETSAGPLELELRQVGGATVARLGTGDTWNSTYTPVPFALFLAEFARLPSDEAEELSTRVFSDWAACPESIPPSKLAAAPRAAAAFAPALVLVALIVVGFGAVGYFVLRVLFP